ncbi:MAG TPA: PilZ domain-containing protein [Terriglobales bacterium]|nr:PilZ domain-containing protein [Terriglobales bacterium]
MASLPVFFPKAHPTQDDRRNEPRFGAEGDVTVVICEGVQEREIAAKLLDFSLHGLRIGLSRELQKDQEVRVIFSWGEATTRVMWTSRLDNRFESGLKLF